MVSVKKLAYGVALGALLAGAGNAADAQETTAGIRGQLVGPSGEPAANATVTITHVPTGTTATAVTNGSGRYATRGLRVGGPYTIKATVGGETRSSDVEQIGVGDPVSVDITFEAGVENRVRTTSRTERENNSALTTRFSAADIRELPSLKRDLKDVARLNPFITLDPSSFDALIAGGVSSRFNSLTIDGVKQNDEFGLNSNGYPTQRSPISIDAVEAMSVNLAPYSVLYNDFQGANINVVTKSGSNDFHGSLVGEYSNEDLIGDKSKGQKFTNAFTERMYSATLGGPIIKNRLFFFGAYEKFEANRSTTAGPLGSGKPIIAGDPNAIPPFITSAQVEAVQSALASRYGFDFDTQNSILGNVSLPESDTKKLAKIDWNITGNHSLALTYQRASSTRLFEGNRSSSTQLALYSDYFTREDDLTVYAAQLNSHWTRNFHTEVAAARKRVVTLQQPVAGAPGNGDVAGDETAEIGQFSIGANPSAPGPTARILAGPDNSHHANEMHTKATIYRGRAFYDLGDHSFTVGVEREKLNVFNLFGQRTEGEFTYNSITDLQNGVVNQLQYQNAILDANGDGVRNEQDLAALFDYSTMNYYAQDTWRIRPDLSVTVGLRYTRYSQSDVPQANAAFLSRYGFSNSANLDGRDALLPRVSFDYRPHWQVFHMSRIRIAAGYGLFSGGSPTVWISNSFSNTGVLGASVSCLRNATSVSCGQAAGTSDNAILALLANAADFKDLPAGIEALLDPAKASINNIRRAANVNALDPDVEPVQTWKASVSFTADLDLWRLGSNYHFFLDFLRGDTLRGVLWQDYRAGLTPIGRAPDGRPIYRRSAERGVLVNGSGTDTGADLVLTNTDQGFQQAIAVGLAKSWRNGLDASLSYTYTDAKDVNPGVASAAAGNFNQLATSDFNHPGLATSNYEIKHQWKGRLSWTHEFRGGNQTLVSLFFERRSGLPYSFVYNASPTQSLAIWGDVGGSRQLFYVPKTDSSGNVTATSDPIVAYATGATAIDINAFNQYLKSSGLIRYAGRISPRNGFKSDDVSRVDLRIQQELPAFFPNGAKLAAYLDIVNLGNLINNKWGAVEQVDFFYAAPIVSTTLVNGGTQYQYSSFQPAVKTLQNSDAPNRSLWQIKLGLRYSF